MNQFCFKYSQNNKNHSITGHTLSYIELCPGNMLARLITLLGNCFGTISYKCFSHSANNTFILINFVCKTAFAFRQFEENLFCMCLDYLRLKQSFHSIMQCSIVINL